MYYVSHDEAVEFCRRLTDSERRARRLPSGWEYRLPTEAEWEYACRAGETKATAFGDKLSSREANFDGNLPYNGAAKGPDLQATTPVGKYPANEWKLCDMHGNVWEWCQDWYDSKLVGGINPRGPSTATNRVFRGGSWNREGRICRSALRGSNDSAIRFDFVGFRVARVPAGP
jgi:formylglycine-generating enzyme required for sulfatase activity